MDEDVQSNSPKFARSAKLAIAFALVLVVGFAGGITAGASGGGKLLSNLSFIGGPSAEPDPSADLTDFWRAWNTLNAKFIQTHGTSSLPTSEEKMWGAIQGLTSAYGDPYTVFMPPEEAKRFAEDISGNFEGVGMEIGIKDGVLTIIAPLKKTPAERAGLLAGDQILSINGTMTEGLSIDEAVKLIRGKKGTEVVFKILRDGEVIDITAVRDVINVPAMETEHDAERGIFIISFYTFSEHAEEEFANALQAFKKSGAKNLIIDVRGNPGGYLDASVEIAGHFLPKGELIVTEDYNGNRPNIEHRSNGTAAFGKGYQIVVLVDQGSASASEILAGALQDNHVATLIGTRSYGKGSVQELVKIGEGSLKVTVARWLTPSGRSISDGGLTPDIEVKRTREDVTAGKDPQMERARAFFESGS